MADTYRVISQRQTNDLTPDGRFVDVMEVTFETIPNQNTGTITVPVAQYNGDNVARLIEDRVKHIMDVESL